MLWSTVKLLPLLWRIALFPKRLSENVHCWTTTEEQASALALLISKTPPIAVVILVLFTNEFLTKTTFAAMLLSPRAKLILQPLKVISLMLTVCTPLKANQKELPDGSWPHIIVAEFIFVALIVKELICNVESVAWSIWWLPGYSSKVMLELRLGLATYCCRVKQGCPMIAPGQGLSGVEMI